MKKGDIVRKQTHYESGAIVYSGFTDPAFGKAFMESEFSRHYGVNPPLYDIISTGENGKLAITIKFPFDAIIDAEVMWLEGGEASLQLLANKTAFLMAHEGTDLQEWIVIREAVASFQSQVETMTDEQLKESIDTLRNGRVVLKAEKAPRKASAPKELTEDDKLQAVLSKMTPQEQEELRKKLGL